MIAVERNRGKYVVILAVGLMIVLFLLALVCYHKNRKVLPQRPMHAGSWKGAAGVKGRLAV